MSNVLKSLVLVCGIGNICWAARCTTVLDPGVLREYDSYVARAEQVMLQRFDSGELTWMPSSLGKDSSAKLASGKLIRWNLSDAALNQRIAPQNGTVIHWIGAVRIRGASITDLQSVLEDYDHYARVYEPMIFECKAECRVRGPHALYDVILGLRSSYRFASLLAQHYAFRVKGTIEHVSNASALRAHLRSTEIRESASGIPGKIDFLEPYHDHGIMWALNAYWRARQVGPDLYFEFETITLARSVQEFACRIGFVPVPRSVIAAAMDSLPADSLTIILERTKAECEHRSVSFPQSR